MQQLRFVLIIFFLYHRYKLKKFQFIKNNSLKLNDGRTIQQAISDNNYLRKLKNFYNSIVNNRSTKQRITEVNNSYFECRNLNYDVKEIRNNNAAFFGKTNIGE